MSIIRFFSLSLLLLLSIGSGMARTEKTVNGAERQIGGLNVRIEFYSPSIVRVTKTVVNGPKAKKSYSVIMRPETLKDLKESKAGDEVTLSSPCIRVTLNTNNGKITFADKKNERLLTDTTTTLDKRTDKANEGQYKIRQTWLLDKDEAIYGLGQLRDTHMNQRGRHVEIWNHNTYISIPYFTSEKGYGVYWDNAGKSYFDDNEAGTFFTSETGTAADYYFIYKDGTQDGVIAGIRTLTGKATMFPLWTMGFWQSRERYKTSDELAGVLDKYRELKIPVDAMVQDWQYWGCDSNWNAMRFQNPYYINKVGDPAWAKYLPKDLKNKKPQGEPRLKTPEEMVNYVHRNDAHLMITIWPDFGPWTEQYKELKAIHALLPFDTWPRNAGALVYDVFNPKAREIYWKHLQYLYHMGFDAWWTDSSEPDHFEKAGDEDYLTYDGSWLSVKNAFPLVHNRSIYEHQRAMKGNDKRSVQMTRSGAFGLQHYGTFSWSGDIMATWDEMKKQVPSGLNYILCGIPMWNTDISGFFYGDYNNDPKNVAVQELKARWMEWGTFMPLMRTHCSSPMVSEIYEMGHQGDWAYDAIVGAIKLRYRLLPYTYSNLGDCVQHDGSMMRPLVMDFANDQKASRLNDEYLFGRNLLVKPITDPMFTWRDSKKNGHLIYPDVKQAAAPVKVYLPKGAKWYDFWDNTVYEGGEDILRPCSIDIMPVFVKAGTIMPFGPDVQYSNEKPWDSLEIRVYPGENGNYTLYEDEGDNYDYEKGQFSEITFSWDDKAHRLTISPRRGSFKGMLKDRTFNIVLVDKNSGTGREPMKVTTSVRYNGKKQTITL
jgi:alpha-D-xyloside xylohydrolase